MITRCEKPAVQAAWFMATVILLTGIIQCRAGTITWTNTAGGDWNVVTNWSPNQVPVNGDDVIITNSGSYGITNASGVTLDKLTLGGTNGTQTLMISSLTLTNTGRVNSNGILNWIGGDLEGTLTVAQGGTLIQSNTLQFVYNNYALGYTNTAYLTNYGTVIWAGTIDASANSSTHGGGGIIYNTGLWNAVADLSMSVYSGSGTNYFINTGTLEKTAATGTSTIGWTFDNEAGTLTTLSGYFTFSGTWSASSVVYGSATVSGPIAGIIASNGVITWNGGDVEGSLTVAPGGTLVQSNTLHFVYNNYALGYTNTAYLTNYGTVIWAGTIDASANSSTHGGGGIIYNAGVWNAVADLSMGVYSGAGTNYFINTGTLEKTAGTGTSTIGWTVENNGKLGSQTNTLSLTGNYDLTGGTLNSGINSPGNYGIIHLSGSPAALTGTLSANLNNGYVPATGSSFPVLTYSSESGIFTNFLPPFAVAMQTNYGGTTFTLTVLNVRPTLAAIANQRVGETTPLTVIASATDPDNGQSLTYALISAPGGMTINSSNGTISWTPVQTQSPSTNTVLVSVTDNGTPPLSATNNFVVVVYEVNSPPILPQISTQTVNAQALLTVNDTAMETNIHAAVGYYLLSAPAGAGINSNGIISWTPLRSQGPNTNIITAVATNADIYDLTNTYLNATNSFTVIVYAPTLAPIANFNVNAGQTISFTASATDNDSTRTLAFSLISPPSGASVNSASGAFNWRPMVSQANTTNTVQVSVADNSLPSLSDTKSFMVVVNPLAPVILTPINYTNGQFKFQVNGTTGPDYIITASTNLSGWSDVFTNLSPSTPFQFTNSMTFTNRFYRVRLSP
jgi:Putative Ig domain